MRNRKQNRSYRKPIIITPTIKPKESDTCKQFVIEFKQRQAWNLLDKDMVAIHIPNESMTTERYRWQLHHMGTRRGILDYLILKRGTLGFIEFKRNAKCKLTPSQEKFIELLKLLEIKWLVTHEVEAAITFCESL